MASDHEPSRAELKRKRRKKRALQFAEEQDTRSYEERVFDAQMAYMTKRRRPKIVPIPEPEPPEPEPPEPGCCGGLARHC